MGKEITPILKTIQEHKTFMKITLFLIFSCIIMISIVDLRS